MTPHIQTGRTCPADPTHEALWWALVRYAGECGYVVPAITLRYVSGLIVDGEALEGYTESRGRRSRVWIDATGTRVQTTLAHELAHAIVHGMTTQEYPEHGAVYAVVESVLQRRLEDLTRTARPIGPKG